MSSSTLAVERRRVHWLVRLGDYIELTKPRISVLVLATVGVSGFVAQRGYPSPWNLLHTLLGTLFVAASASALNQLLEQRRDALMDRTANRPLPAERLSRFEVVTFSAASMFAGTLYLAIATNGMTALLGLLTWFLYVWVYTPLKSRTVLNTVVGAVAGALPVLMGWSATGATLDPRLDPRAAALFLIVFLWQFPHFMAIAWIYRKQYARAKLKMLPVVDPTGRRAGVQSVLAALVLIPVSFVPGMFVSGGSVYVVAALILGLGQLVCAATFFTRLNEASARLLLRASLVYLPALLALLMLVLFV